MGGTQASKLRGRGGRGNLRFSPSFSLPFLARSTQAIGPWWLLSFSLSNLVWQGGMRRISFGDLSVTKLGILRAWTGFSVQNQLNPGIIAQISTVDLFTRGQMEAYMNSYRWLNRRQMENNVFLFWLCYKRNGKRCSCATMELWMHLGGLLSTQDSYASFVLSNLPRASITPWLHAARLPFLNLTAHDKGMQGPGPISRNSVLERTSWLQFRLQWTTLRVER